jgi:hypothetical protein
LHENEDKVIKYEQLLWINSDYLDNFEQVHHHLDMVENVSLSMKAKIE